MNHHKGLTSKTLKQFMQLNIKTHTHTHTHTHTKRAEDLDRHFFKDNTQMANKHMKRCLTSLIMREMQIKTTVRCHITPVKWPSSKKSTDNKCWRECREKGKLCSVGGNIS